MSLIFYEADGVGIRLDVTIEPGADVVALTGADFSVVAQRLGGGTQEGSAEVDGTDLIIRYGPYALLPGTWMIQVRVIPPDHAGVTLREPLSVEIRRSIQRPPTGP